MNTAANNESSLAKLTALPLGMKIVTFIIVALVLIFLGFLLEKPIQSSKLRALKNSEHTLKRNFAAKHKQYVKLSQTELKTKQLKKQIQMLAKQLPQEINVDQLLEKITNYATSDGLKIVSFKPSTTKPSTMYQQVAINIAILGSYHQLAGFIRNIVNMKSLITIDKFRIYRANKKRDILTLHATLTVYKPELN